MPRLRVDAAPVHPAAQVGGYGDVGRGRDYVVRKRGMAACDIGQQPPEALLRRLAGRGGRRQRRRHGHARRVVAALGRLVERDRRQEVVERTGRQVESGERLPLGALGNPHPVAEVGHLLGRHHPRVVVLVAGERQAEALDGVGDEACRPLVLRGLAEPRQHAVYVVPRQVRHEAGQRRVVVLVEQLADAGGVAQVPHQPRPPGRAALIGQRRVDRVGTVIDPGPQRVAAAAFERRLQARAVLERDDAPLHRLEDGVQAVEETVGHDRVEALAVVVDDPPDVGDLVLPRFEQRLEDVALVELRIARQRDHAARRLAVVYQLLLAQELLRQRGKARHGDAHPHRAGRDVHVVAVLRAGRIRLRAAERPETFELVARLAAEQVLDGVEHRAAVRLHGHAVLRPQRVEVERGHQADHRRT